MPQKITLVPVGSTRSDYPGRRLLMLLLLLLGGISAGGCSGSGKVAFDKQKFVFSGSERQYAVYKPENYNRDKLYPAILFLHGLFEGGSDGKSMTTVGIGPAIRDHPERFKCVVIMAQTSGSWRDDSQVALAMAHLDDALRKYNIDPRRVVVTGLSTGGTGCYKLAAKFPDRFAALAPFCAFGEYNLVPKLPRIPVWAFHNSIDPFVGSGQSVKMVEKINKAGGDAKVTIYKTFGHNCWDQAYGDSAVVAWMQSQKK